MLNTSLSKDLHTQKHDLHMLPEEENKQTKPKVNKNKTKQKNHKQNKKTHIIFQIPLCELHSKGNKRKRRK